jgi:uncharacterized protein YqgC (DUF456 family)
MLAGGSTAVAVLTTVVYVAVIQKEGNDPFWEVFPWVTIMLIGTFLALGSVLTRNPGVGRFSATAAAVILGLLGMVAIFSVGLGFIVAAVLALLAAVRPSATAVPVS